MSLFRNHPRISDSDIDPEDTTALHELCELAISEKDFRIALPPTPSPPQTSLVVPTIPIPARSPSAHSARTERCEEMEKAEKMLVFKDEVKPRSQSKNRSKNKKAASNAMTRPLKPVGESRKEMHIHARSNSESSASKVQQPTLPISGTVTASATGENFGTSSTRVNASKPASAPTTLDIIQKLHDISQLRRELLQQLNEVDKQEKTLLSTLLHLSLSSLSSPSLSHSTQHFAPTHENTNPTPLPQSQTLPYSQTPIQHQQQYQQPPLKKPRPSHIRTVSAPPQSTPSHSHALNRPPSTSKRIPLADKTESSLATFDSTPISGAREWVASPMKTVQSRTGGGTKGVEEGEGDIREAGAGAELGQRMSVRVPMKFGDESEDDDDEKASTMHTSAGMHEGGSDESGKNVTSASPGYFTATPGGVLKENGYEVPYTVQRKTWQF